MTPARLSRVGFEKLHLRIMREHPRSVQEAVKQLLLELSDTDKLAIKNTSEEELDKFHLTLGSYIRNEFGLWTNNEELLKDCFPEGSK